METTAFAQRAFALALAMLSCCSSLAAAIQPEALRSLSPDVLTKQRRREFQQAAHRLLRARGRHTNRADMAAWKQVKNRGDWEGLRNKRLARLRESLRLPKRHTAKLKVHTTRVYRGDQFAIENVLYESRPRLWVTANLYRPLQPRRLSPALILVHSHHRPKTQGELQDMGMTWARRGCFVLVIDQLGHGERADHPFQGPDDYRPDPKYRWWRQDYYHRRNTNQQLHVTGESLMGWMVWDLMRGVDLLRERPQVDPQKIIILGAVAGGGDPAGVTAALDQRIAAAVPFNFGGPQPENRYPLPADAETSFNYLGGAYWDNTRNLRRTGVDGFLHWVIVGSIAPRPLVYAHEFAWDRPRDPVWKRLNQIYTFYGKANNIDYTLGAGSVRGSSSKDTHCTNIGKYHRRRIHAAFRRWFDIDVKPEHEYRRRLRPAQLHCWTRPLRDKLQPGQLHRLLEKMAERRIQTVQSAQQRLATAARRTAARKSWRTLLGQIDPKQQPKVVAKRQEKLADSVRVERIELLAENGLSLPLLLLRPQAQQSNQPLIVAVAEAGIRGFLKHRAEALAEILRAGRSVCLFDVRPASGSTHDYALYFETPIVGYQLRDVRAVLQHLRSRRELGRGFVLWGDSLTTPNEATTDFRVPYRVRRSQPTQTSSLGGMLAMLAALYEDDVRAVFVRGGLSGFQDALVSPHVRLRSVVPQAIVHGDLPELAAALAPQPLRLAAMVDGLNRIVPLKQVRKRYHAALQAYQRADTTEPLTLQTTTNQQAAAKWLLSH